MTAGNVLINTGDTSHWKLRKTNLWWKPDTSKYLLLKERVLSRQTVRFLQPYCLKFFSLLTTFWLMEPCY